MIAASVDRAAAQPRRHTTHLEAVRGRTDVRAEAPQPVDDRFEVFGDAALLEAWRAGVAV